VGRAVAARLVLITTVVGSAVSAGPSSAVRAGPGPSPSAGPTADPVRALVFGLPGPLAVGPAGPAGRSVGPAGPSPATQSSQAAPPQLRSRTDHFATEVIVRDTRRRFVADLKLEDFEIFEDGVRQQPSTFSLIAGGRSIPAPETPVRREGLILPRAAPPELGRVFAILVDDMNIQPSDTVLARKALHLIRDTVFQDGDLIVMVSTGPSSIQGAATYRYTNARFNAEVGRVMGNGMTVDEILAASNTAEGPAGLRYHAHVAFSTAYDLIDQLANIKDRRKAIFYVSSGYDFNPLTNSRFKLMQDALDAGQGGGDLSAEDIRRHRNPLESGTQRFSESDLVAELASLTRAAQRANVTFYPVDPRGLLAGVPVNARITAEEWNATWTKSLTSLQVLASETGGICLCNINDIRPRLREVDDATSDYYLIGYTPSNTDARRIRRTVEIRVRRPGLTVSGYRTTYTIR
jgi:VWFA-related protein